MIGRIVIRGSIHLKDMQISCLEIFQKGTLGITVHDKDSGILYVFAKIEGKSSISIISPGTAIKTIQGRL